MSWASWRGPVLLTGGACESEGDACSSKILLASRSSPSMSEISPSSLTSLMVTLVARKGAGAGARAANSGRGCGGVPRAASAGCAVASAPPGRQGGSGEVEEESPLPSAAAAVATLARWAARLTRRLRPRPCESPGIQSDRVGGGGAEAAGVRCDHQALLQCAHACWLGRLEVRQKLHTQNFGLGTGALAGRAVRACADATRVAAPAAARGAIHGAFAICKAGVATGAAAASVDM